MNDASPALVATIAGTFFAAGVVKGVTGMGLPTVAMGVLGAMLSPVTAAGLLLAPSFVTNVWQLLAGPRFGALVGRLWPMMILIVIGTVAGSALLTGAASIQATVGLGVALAAYAAYTLFAKPFAVPRDWERWTSPTVGLTTGLVTGATGVFVMPAVPYIQSLNLERDDLVQALGLSFTVSTVALAAGLLLHGAAPASSLLASVAAVLPALLGMMAGQALRNRISAALFKRVFLLFLLLLGLEMASRELL
jgi:uncharacterized membrane protein YfcA